MGSRQPTPTTCTSSSLPPPSWPQLLADSPPAYGAPAHTTLPLLTRPRGSSPLSHSPTSMESLMTTLRPTSRRLRPRMLRARLLDLSPSLSLTAESRPPPTLLITTMDLLPRSPTREPQSTPQSPRKDTDTLPQSTRLLQPTPLPLPTSPLLNLFCAGTRTYLLIFIQKK